jgi:hypothetical protein
VLSGDGTHLVRVEGYETVGITQRVRLPYRPHAIALDADGLWCLDFSGALELRATGDGSLLTQTEIGGTPNRLATSEDAVYVHHQVHIPDPRPLTRVAKSDQIVTQIDTAGTPVHATSEYVYVVEHPYFDRSHVVEINLDSGDRRLLADGDNLWPVFYREGTVWVDSFPAYGHLSILSAHDASTIFDDYLGHIDEGLHHLTRGPGAIFGLFLSAEDEAGIGRFGLRGGLETYTRIRGAFQLAGSDESLWIAVRPSKGDQMKPHDERVVRLSPTDLSEIGEVIISGRVGAIVAMP